MADLWNDGPSEWRADTVPFRPIIRAVPDLTISDPSGFGPGSGFRENLFSDHRTIRLMKLMASTMLSAAIKRQFGASFVMFASFNKICGLASGNGFYILCPGNTN